MTPSYRCLALIKEFEGLRLEAYQDVTGRWTIGYGHAGPDVHEGDVWTAALADLHAIYDMQRAWQLSEDAIRVPVTQNQCDALTDFAYNLGWIRLSQSTLVAAINAGNIEQAAEEFLRWDYAGGIVEPGLQRRREAERTLFLSPE